MKKISIILLLVFISLPVIPHARSYLTAVSGSQVGEKSGNPYKTRIIITPLESTPSLSPSTIPTPTGESLFLREDDLLLDDLDLENDFSTDSFDDLTLDEFNTSDDLLSDPEFFPQRNEISGSPSTSPVVPPKPQITIPDPLDQGKTPVAQTVTSTSDLGIRLEKIGGKSGAVSPGETLEFSAEVTNIGPNIAHNAIAEISYGQNGFLDLIDTPTDCLDDQEKLVCVISSLSPGESKAITFSGKVPDGVSDGAGFINAGISFQGVDTNVSDNIGSLRLDIGKMAAWEKMDFSRTLKEISSLSKQLLIESASAAGTDSEQDSESRILLARGLIMPVFAIEETTEKVLIPDIAVNPKVAQPDDNLIFILTVSNNSQTQYSKVHATVFYPFDYLDLVTASEPYSYNQDEESVDFVKETLNPGERWLIRINGKVKNAETVIPDKSPRTIVNSFTIEAEEPKLTDDFASTQVLIVSQKENPEPSNSPSVSPQVTTPPPASGTPAASPAPSQTPKPVISGPIGYLTGSGPAQSLLFVLAASVLGGLFLTIRHQRKQHSK